MFALARVGVALATALGFSAQSSGGPAQASARSSDPPFELKFPVGYRHLSDPTTGTYYERRAGSDDWERIQIRFFIGENALPQDGPPPELEAIAKRAEIPDDAKLGPTKERWKEFEIQGVEAKFDHKGMPFFGMAATVPLERKAVTLAIFAPAPLDKQVRPDFKALLQGLSGKTDWITKEERQRLRQADWCIYAGAGLAVLYLACLLVLFRKKPMLAHMPRTIWMAVTALLFFMPLIFGHAWWPGCMVLCFLLFSMMVRRVKMGIEEGD